MSKYTTELRYLIEQGFDIGLNDYPIFDEKYRPILNQKIINRYYFREIGSETPGRFRFHLRAIMDEIMPYYNKMYEMDAQELNPLYTVDYTETYTRDFDGETDTRQKRVSTGTGKLDTTRETDSEVFTVESDTPAGLISVEDIKGNVWASRANRGEDQQAITGRDESLTTSEDDSDSTTTLNNLENFTRHVIGNNSGRSQASLIQEFRQSLINIDRMIMDELNILFMGVF